MSSNQISHKLESLLQKFHSGKMTLEEFKELVYQLDKTSEDELSRILKKMWEEFDDFEDLSEDKINALFEKIRFHHYRFHWWRNNWLRVAAAILLLMVCGLTILTFMNYNGMREMADRQLLFQSGETGRSAVILPDSSRVILNANSSVSYLQNFGYRDREVCLNGEAFFDVRHDSKRKFVVKTPDMNVIVYGTMFNMYAYSDKNIVEMMLVKGHVKVRGNHPPYPTINVEPNQKVTFDRKANKMYLQEANPSIETSWINKELSFKHEKLYNVFRALEHRFNVVINVTDRIMLNDSYTGTFDDRDVESIIKVLQINYGFKYQRNADKITIYPK